MASLCPHFTTHIYGLFKKQTNVIVHMQPLLHFCLKPIWIIPVVIIGDIRMCYMLRFKVLMRIYGSTLGCYYFLCHEGYVCLLCYCDIGPYSLRCDRQCVIETNLMFAKIEQILTKYESRLELHIKTLERKLLLDVQVNLMRHPEFTQRLCNCNKSRSPFCI